MSSTVNDVGKVAGKFDSLGDNSRYDDGDEAADETNDDDVGDGDGQIAGFAREEVGETVD